ncbi:MAG: glycoside hydrolase family 99-like domain-containing protein [Clostridia bacterium]|nr:glycoside hydrolase family 99-like domain-containing protein [Clostridia bacterium]
MRWFAFYLPQFHEVKENNEWWGKGFTEWTHVKAAKPLYKSHVQPIVPQRNNYYDLMNKETVLWQTDLMKQYGVDGFVYYHYYFCGQKLLEKPAENLLMWQDIDQPFFFCWANHTWYQAKNGEKKVLREQTYGLPADWETHFQYLLPFFKDVRYEKKDNKPVFMIYNPFFEEKKEMMDYFDRRCKEEGFSGIYIIETFADSSKPENYEIFRNNLCVQTEKSFIREPSYSTCIENRKRKYSPLRIWRAVVRRLAQRGFVRWVNRYSGNRLYHTMRTQSLRGDDLCHGAFFSWDNTPRHGARGYVITPPSKKQFMRYADSVREDEYVFINAWNEWAEGMILEPTEHEGTRYLEWIREWNQKNR